jgi:RNA polymerase sigma-70 factor, ECF subfamily
LSPAFLLHDAFSVPFAEVGLILEGSEAGRQLAARARKAIRQAKPSSPVPREVHCGLLGAFMAALNEGDATLLKSLLLTGLGRWYRPPEGSVSATPALINGSDALLLCVDGAPVQMWTIATDGSHIVAVYIVSNPEKLARLA